MDDNYFDFIIFNILQRGTQSFDSTLNVSFNDDIQVFDLALLDTLEQVIQRNLGILLDLFNTFFRNTFFSNAAGNFFVGRIEDITGQRYIVQAQNLYRSRRQCFFDFFATVIDHSTYLTISSSGNDRITDLQSTALN